MIRILAAAFLKRQKADGIPPAFLQPGTLLDFSNRASVNQLLQRSVGIRLGNAFLDVLWRAINQVLGFFQAQAGNGANCLDYVHLVVTGLQ